MSTLILVLAFFTAPGYDGAAMIPISYGLSIVEIATHHGVDPADVAGMMAAENRSRRYDPATVGRYGRGGESGLMQLVDAWKMEALERCNARLRRGHHRYSGEGDCVAIGPRDRWEDLDLFDARQNIEAAVIALRYMTSAETLARKPWLNHWEVQYRCNPRAYGRGWIRPRCKASAQRAHGWRMAVRDQVELIEGAVEVTTASVMSLSALARAWSGGGAVEVALVGE